MVNKYARVTGGADRNCLAVIAELRRRGHEVCLLSTASSENVVNEGAFIEAQVTHQTRQQLPSLAKVRVAISALWNPAAAKAMRELLARFKPDLIHAHKLYPQISIAPLVIAGKAGVPIVQTLHDYELLAASALDDRGRWVDHDEERPSYRALNTVTLPVRRGVYAPRVTAFIACSRFVAERFRSAIGVDATVLPYFVETQRRAPLEFAERQGAVFVGRLHPEKGVQDVISLAEQLPALRTTIIGYGPLEGQVAEAARRLPNLTFAGRQDRPTVMDSLERARVCVMPSRWQEPGGIAALEAMSAGTPVVAYANGGLAEYVTDAGGGRAIEPSVSALVAETDALASSPERWREYSIQARIGVESLHSADRYMAGLDAVYARALR